jgi:hypothetical protein
VGNDVRLLARELERLHPNPWHDLSPLEWADAVERLAASFDGLEPDGQLVELMRLTALLGDRDGHTGLDPFADHRHPLHLVPLQLYDFAGGLYVVDSLADTALVGKRLAGIGHVPVELVVEAVRPLVGHDTGRSCRGVGEDPGSVSDQDAAVYPAPAAKADLARVGVDFILPLNGHAVDAADAVGELEVPEDEAFGRGSQRGQVAADVDGPAEKRGRIGLQARQRERTGAVGRAGELPEVVGRKQPRCGRSVRSRKREEYRLQVGDLVQEARAGGGVDDGDAVARRDDSERLSGAVAGGERCLLE